MKSLVMASGKQKQMRGRALMLVRNVGHLMSNQPSPCRMVPKSPRYLDAFMTVAGALPDFANKLNSLTGSIYIVKPKPWLRRSRLCCHIFEAVEDLLLSGILSKLALWMKNAAPQSI